MRDADSTSLSRKRQGGFTLVELSVVIAVIGIICKLAIGVSTRTYGVNANTFSQQLAGSVNLARTRALMTRRIHRVAVHLEMEPPEIDVWQADKFGMEISNIDSASFVERIRIPAGITLWAAKTGAQAAGQSPVQTTSELDIDFLPDGSATAATIYITDPNKSRMNRVLVYHATGSAYARQDW